MLYSEVAERENRFVLSMKIIIPFILTIAFFSYIFFKNDDYSWQDTVLFLILIVCYVYYTIYLIYFGFKRTLVDPVTNTFIRSEIIKILNKIIKSKNVVNIVLIKITNIVDINERYGYKNGDEVLKNFIIRFDAYMNENGFGKIIIGNFVNGNFIFSIKCKSNHLEHVLSVFEHQILNKAINNIEVKINYAFLPSNYDKNLQNIVNALFYKISHKNEDENKADDNFENLVLNLIDNDEFLIKSQIIKSMKNGENFNNYIIKLNGKENGEITKTKALDVIFRNQYNYKFDLNLIKFLSRNIYFKDIKNKIFIEIFASTLRSNDFKNEILKLISNNLIDPNKIVFEFNENTIYDEVPRFAEIINQYRTFGFSFALSQFGGANASFEYFKHLNIDFVIYDLEFTKFINNEKFRTIFEGLNKTCTILNIQTLVRFVDKKPLYDELEKLGVDFVQGFYISKPENLQTLKG